MRLLFFGSPGVAVPFLEACLDAGHEVAAVLTQPDKPAGRGLELKAPAVKEAARRLGLSVLQPERPSDLTHQLRALEADMAVVVAYGRILKPDLLAVTDHGFMNVHFSLLPAYRGAAPVQWALMRGESRTGVTLFWLDAGMDTGPVQRLAGLEVPPDEDAVSLFPRLVALGVAELGAALADVAAGRLRRAPQGGPATLAPKLTAEDARIGFDMPAAEIHNRTRGLAAGPGAWFSARSGDRALRVKLFKTGLADASATGRPGRIVVVEPDGGVLIQCGPGILRLREVQPEGKKRLPASEFLKGLRLKAGDSILGPV
ncbi:MAG: methionyl-tRNA formyltransferase [Elusimicrobia bacterium]|nr:methionyl-tRNA formyltransferase [Elusimicrobiota bacterium]